MKTPKLNKNRTHLVQSMESYCSCSCACTCNCTCPCNPFIQGASANGTDTNGPSIGNNNVVITRGTNAAAISSLRP